MPEPAATQILATKVVADGPSAARVELTIADAATLEEASETISVSVDIKLDHETAPLAEYQSREGPFPDESLVCILAPSGEISGFAKNSDIDHLDKNKGYVRAIVRSVEGDSVTVLLAGSYFTTAGIAKLPTGWARENLALAAKA